MTDQMPTHHENFLSIADKFRTMPQDVDPNGKSADEKARNAALVAEFIDSSPYAHLEPEPEPHIGMKPNPAQGHGGAPASPTGSGGSLLDRLRANAAKALDDGPGAA